MITHCDEKDVDKILAGVLPRQAVDVGLYFAEDCFHLIKDEEDRKITRKFITNAEELMAATSRLAAWDDDEWEATATDLLSGRETIRWYAAICCASAALAAAKNFRLNYRNAAYELLKYAAMLAARAHSVNENCTAITNSFTYNAKFEEYRIICLACRTKFVAQDPILLGLSGGINDRSEIIALIDRLTEIGEEFAVKTVDIPSFNSRGFFFPLVPGISDVSVEKLYDKLFKYKKALEIILKNHECTQRSLDQTND